MHTKRFRNLSLDLCEDAVRECFEGKWKRRDVLAFTEKYAGIQRHEILLEYLTHDRAIRDEAIHAVGLYLWEVLEDLTATGHEPEDLVPVKIRQRPDGMTGKVRDIALLCILHQLIGHAAKLMLEPLFDARLLPTQHASIPGHGQTKLKDQTRRLLLADLGIRYYRKTDVVHAYASLQYSVVIGLVRKECPKAGELIAILEYLGKLAPDGHLIIGGYLDAWLFNFAMSYAIRFVYTLGVTRRGKFIRHIIRVETFMDDFSLMSASVKGIERASAALEIWMRENLQLDLKYTTGIVKLLSIEEEKDRKTKETPAARGVPVIDMAGFKIARTHTMIRSRVFLRARRQFLRGYAELQQTGTLRQVRAQKIISYNSYIEQTNSQKLRDKYHIAELMAVATTVRGFYSRLQQKHEQEALYDLQKRRGRPVPGEGEAGAAAGQNDRPDDGQREALRDGSRGGSGQPDYVPF